MSRWKVEYFHTKSGREPIQEFIDRLSPTTKARVANTLDLLSEFGPELRRPHVRKVANTPFWELRILGEASARFFYITKKDNVFLILHGFTKKSQKTPKKEIKVALGRLKNHG
jgi:phage-related protein